MKKSLFTWTVTAALTLSLAGCGIARPAQSEAPTTAPQVTAEVPATTQDDTQAATAEPSRQDGERFETVIILEGMEETVHYEHIRNDEAGFEMDYDYETFTRRSEGDRELFISAWDDPEHPENYLEVTYDTGSAELVADAISATLSNEYEVTRESYELDRAGSCIRLDASEVKGGGVMPEHLQEVYIIPAPDGVRIATAHCFIAESEGFFHRFAYMLNTLTVFDRSGDMTLSDELALSAIRNYCYSSNPDLEGIVKDGEYPVSWEIVSEDERQVVVLFRSYTGAEVRYYIDRATGDTYVTEFVPGITPAEERTEESLNVWEYVY